jgi:hypothetical protein
MRLPIATLLCIAAAASAATASADTEPGNLWDVTTSMEMGGMKMPGQKQQVCAPVNAEGPEAMASDERCQMSNVRRSPGKFTYDVQCPDGSGTGEMTYQGRDSYTSRMTMTQGGETMTMVMTGKRAGSCDASKVKKQVAAMEAQGAAAMDQACASSVSSLMPASLANCDPKYKKQLCDQVATKKGFKAVAQRQPVGNPMIDSGTLPEVAKYCGVQADALRTRLCNEAGKTEDLDFIGAACPTLAAPIAQRECAGRGFSSPPAEKYRDFCGTYARGLMQGSSGSDVPEGGEAATGNGTGGDTPATAPTAKDVMKEGAKALKGLFGR